MMKLKDIRKDVILGRVLNGIKKHFTVFDYMDELVSEYNLDKEEQGILPTLFKEVYDYFNAD